MRTDKEILKIALENVSNLTNQEFDRYQVLQKMPPEERYAKKAHGGDISSADVWHQPATKTNPEDFKPIGTYDPTTDKPENRQPMRLKKYRGRSAQGSAEKS
jgi:hypothetical protein